MTSAYAYLGDQAEDAGDRIGMALSGGGIRAACLGLGALQAADETGVLPRLRWITSVSGGSYIAAAFCAGRAVKADAGVPAWAPGSIEEQHLRRNLRYLARDLHDVMAGSLRYVVGLAARTLPLLSAIALLGIVLGIGFDAAGMLRTDPEGALAARHAPWRWLAAVAAAVGGTAAGSSLHKRGRSVFGACLALAPLLLLPDVVAATDPLSPGRSSAPPDAAPAGTFLVAGLLSLLVILGQQWFPVPGLVRRAVRGAAEMLVVLSFAALFLGLLVYGVRFGANAQTQWLAGGAVAVLMVVMVGLPLLPDVNATSLHRPYARRLQRAFIAYGTGDAPVLLDKVKLVDLRDSEPELVVCAAVNLSVLESARGEGCASFTFSSSGLGFPGQPSPVSIAAVRGQTGAPAPTDPGALTLASAIAASGAAVAPNMGRFTQSTLRLVLSLLNLRLGLWLRNPFIGADAADSTLAAQLRSRFVMNGPVAAMREALGRLSSTAPYLFISDGGHWDNSGVVELLRRRCDTIFALDASTDEHRLANVLRLISLARMELGVEFDADAALLDNPDPVVVLPYTYPPSAGRGAGRLILMRTAPSPSWPVDLSALRRRGTSFPAHSTLNQFFSARECDAYIGLGRWLFRRSSALADLPPAIGLQHDRQDEAAEALQAGSTVISVGLV